MTKGVLFLIICFCGLPIYGQWFQSTADELGVLSVESIPSPKLVVKRTSDEVYDQLSGFPKGFPADMNFKNFRNVTLADLDNDGADEILIGIGGFFSVWKADSLWWSTEVQGTMIYPPTVGDLDQDGDLEIIQTTGGIPSSGKTYGWDHLGIELDGWPRQLDQNWILTAAAMEDMNDDGLKEVILIERVPPGGRVHIINNDASLYGNGWPVTLPGTPATTPSIADIDQDGLKDIIVASTTVLYALDLAGNNKPGWPIENTNTRFSFQSPILVDLDGDFHIEVIGATHGNRPEYYIHRYDASPHPGWPIPVPDRSWTFSPPTVVPINNQWNIFMGRPLGSESPDDMLFGWHPDGMPIESFPINKLGGNEGVIAVADLNGDGEYEVIFSSNLFDGESERGFIHAYSRSTGLELNGFPLRPYGWTYMNGGTLGDVNGDGLLDMVSLSYTQNFGEGIDSTFINVYGLNTPLNEETILWGTYKGSNDRKGYIEKTLSTTTKTIESIEGLIYPNPTSGYLSIPFDQARLKMVDLSGRVVFDEVIPQTTELHVPSGMYIIELHHDKKQYTGKVLIF